MIGQNNANTISLKLARKFGFTIRSTLGQDQKGTYINLIIKGIDPTDGFLIHIRIGWRSITAEFIPGKFSASLMQEMSSAPKENVNASLICP